MLDGRLACLDRSPATIKRRDLVRIGVNSGAVLVQISASRSGTLMPRSLARSCSAVAVASSSSMVWVFDIMPYL